MAWRRRVSRLILESADVPALRQRLHTLEELVRAKVNNGPTPEDKCPAPVEHPSELPGFDYNRFVTALGPNSAIVGDIYSRYVPWFKGCKRVADLGSGRGIFLEVLRKHGIPAYGVDTDTVHVQSCGYRGLEATVDGAVEHLAGLEPGAIDGIFLGHVIEHLPHAVKFRFARLAFEKLAPRGVLAVETPNTRSPFVMSHVYYLDPTHQAPLHPDAYQFMFKETGFKVLLSEFHMLHPGQDKEDQISCMNYSLVLSKP